MNLRSRWPRVLAVLGPVAVAGWLLVFHGRTTSLRAEVGAATRLRVRTAGTRPWDVAAERTLLDVTDPNEISGILGSIHVAGAAPPCACRGDATIEVFRGADLVAELSVHHGKHLRWPGHWRGDRVLTGDSAAFVQHWLRANGATLSE
jgi:hypothetical protein